MGMHKGEGGAPSAAPAPRPAGPLRKYPPINSCHVLETPAGEQLFRVLKSSYHRTVLVPLSPGEVERLHAQLTAKHRALDEMKAQRAAAGGTGLLGKLRRMLSRSPAPIPGPDPAASAVGNQDVPASADDEVKP